MPWSAPPSTDCSPWSPASSDPREYARDAVLQGRHKALIVLGHANSEEAGMKWLVEWLAPLVPDVPIIHVSAGDPFRFL